MTRRLRFILRWLWEHHGAPKLDHCVPNCARVRPRNVVATREEVDALLAIAKPSMRLWILFCSDLGIRSGTADRISPRNYDPTAGLLRFTTKGQSKQMLPATDEIRDMLDPLDHSSRVPYVWQLRVAEYRARFRNGRDIEAFDTTALRREFIELRKDAGLTRRVTPHDMRRALAVKVLEQTHDLRDVQSVLGHSDLRTTLWYLDHDLKPVQRRLLELVKRPAQKEERTA